MKLKKLLKDIRLTAVRGSQEIDISGLCSHSRFVSPGNLFIAKRGESYDGSSFIPQAVASGAIAVLTDLYDPFLSQVTQILHPDPVKLESLLAERYYNAPSEEMLLIGVTGTNGKTTCSYGIRHLLEGVGKKCGLIGTIEWIVGEHTLPALYTTPDILTTSKLLRETIQAGFSASVMEVSSHALDQGRTDGLDYDIALFTNLTQDHLDYHGTLEAYAKAKAGLFQGLGKNSRSKKKSPKWAIVNADSSWTPLMLKECSVPWLTYGIDRFSDVQAQNIRMTPQGTLFEISWKGEAHLFSTPLIGRFNIYNLLAIITTGLALQIELSTLVPLIASFRGAAGRLETVPNPLGIPLFVDYAHTPDALENVLKTLKEIAPSKIITVFGCGGNRDKTKRPLMGRAVENYSDLVVITSDNPRCEDPHEIIRQILPGLERPEKAIIHVDRREAIRFALQAATSTDIVLIAGRGHERYQIIGQRSLPFDDCEESLRICQELAHSH